MLEDEGTFSWHAQTTPAMKEVNKTPDNRIRLRISFTPVIIEPGEIGRALLEQSGRFKGTAAAFGAPATGISLEQSQ
jgi:hypothetical protein